MPAPLPQLRLPTLSALSSPFSFRTRTPIASPFATPDSFREAAAASADISSLKIAKTTVLFDMSPPFRFPRSCERSRRLPDGSADNDVAGPGCCAHHPGITLGGVICGGGDDASPGRG